MNRAWIMGPATCIDGLLALSCQQLGGLHMGLQAVRWLTWQVVAHLCKAELSQQQLRKDWQQQGVLAQGEGHLLLKGGLLHQARNSTSGNTNTNSCRHAHNQQIHNKHVAVVP